MGQTYSSNKILPEICIIRLVLGLLVIIYHSFCPFIGSPYWAPIMENAPDEYYYIALWSSPFTIEAYTFISGYTYGYQIFSGIHKVSFNSTVISKAKRLLIPAIVFSLIYILMFNNYDSFNLYNWVSNILNGAGHLWYLPLLFWCFVALFIIEKIHINQKVVILLLFLASVFSIYPLPNRITEASYYMIYFYMGYAIKRTPFSINKYINRFSIIGLWIAFIALYSVNLLVIDILFPTTESTSFEPSSIIIWNFNKLLYSFTGTFAILFTTIHVIKNGYLTVTGSIVKLSKYAFGIFILQEFIIKILYYKMSITQHLGILTPLFTVIITTVLSILIVHIYRAAQKGYRFTMNSHATRR